MKITQLFTGDDHLSYFREVDTGPSTVEKLGNYSARNSATSLTFRDFEAGLRYDWHNPPQRQYIIYLNGAIEVEASGGEKRIFRPGDVLFATDLSGKGHVTRTLTPGLSIIVTTE